MNFKPVLCWEAAWYDICHNTHSHTRVCAHRETERAGLQVCFMLQLMKYIFQPPHTSLSNDHPTSSLSISVVLCLICSIGFNSPLPQLDYLFFLCSFFEHCHIVPTIFDCASFITFKIHLIILSCGQTRMSCFAR